MQAPFPPPKILIDSDLLRAYPIGIGVSRGLAGALRVVAEQKLRKEFPIDG
jgi:hypothetical protein